MGLLNFYGVGKTPLTGAPFLSAISHSPQLLFSRKKTLINLFFIFNISVSALVVFPPWLSSLIVI